MVPRSKKETKKRKLRIGISCKSSFRRIRFSMTGSIEKAASPSSDNVGVNVAATCAGSFSAMAFASNNVLPIEGEVKFAHAEAKGGSVKC